MANQACISIGINQYQYLQPLGYGLADAVAMEQFFVDSAGWNPTQCLLLTDTSAQREDKSTYPDRENIDRWIQQWCWDKLRPGDSLWFFFSGHGVSSNGEDYLVPIDGKAEDIPNTCISIRNLYKQFHDIGVQALVFIDANRAQSVALGGGIGKIATQLARDYNIPTFLSCQSHEFSHEAAGLGHGLFTKALLEALNYHPDLNIEILESYLTSRLGELSEHHWKPLQTPVAIVSDQTSIYRPVFSPTTQSSISTATPELVFSPPTQPQLGDIDDGFCYTPPSMIAIDPNIAGSGAIVLRKPVQPPKQVSKWTKVGFLLAMMLGAGGGIFALQERQQFRENDPSIVRSIDSSSTSTEKIPSLADAKLLVKPGDATSRYLAILAASKIPADDPNNSEVKQSIELWSQEIYDIAKSFANKQQWELAVNTAKMVAPNTTNYSAVQSAISEWAVKIPNRG